MPPAVQATSKGNDAVTAAGSSHDILVAAPSAVGSVAIIGVSAGSPQSAIVTPPGWTLLAGPDLISTHSNYFLFGKTLDAGDLGANVPIVFGTTDSPVSVRAVSLMAVISDVTLSGAVVVKDTRAAAGTVVGTPEATVPAGGMFLVMHGRRVGADVAPNVTPPAGYSQTGHFRVASAFAATGVNLSMEQAYKVNGGSAAVLGGETSTADISSTGHSYGVALAPAVEAGGRQRYSVGTDSTLKLCPSRMSVVNGVLA